jgi:hypothetical protein
LSPEFTARLGLVDSARLGAQLRRLGLRDALVDEAMTRLLHVRCEGLAALVKYPVFGMPSWLVVAGRAAIAGGVIRVPSQISRATAFTTVPIEP